MIVGLPEVVRGSTQCGKSVLSGHRRVENAVSVNLHGWRIRADVFCRHVCVPLERTREWAHTSRHKASRRMRHPILISFRGPKAHPGRLQRARVCAGHRRHGG